MTFDRQPLISLKSASVLAILLVLVAAVGAAGSWVTLPQIPGWYAGLVKPVFTPPNWLFGPAWTTLYLLMALAAWFVAMSGSSRSRQAMALWGTQLLLNCIWSFLFFGMQRPDLALADILLLDIAIIVCMREFRFIHRPSFLLMLPYILWTLYATALNFEIWRLN